MAAWGSFIFGIIVAIYSVLFTRKMMDLAQKKYVAEEGDISMSEKGIEYIKSGMGNIWVRGKHSGTV